MKEVLRNEKIMRLLMLLALVALSIKYIFVDFGIDAEFQISMSYRLAKGDLMFKEMWEAYQMSAFLCAILIKIYLALFQTTTGIVLYLQLMGVLIDGAVSFLLYKTVTKYCDCPKVAFAMAWVFFVVSPKDVPLPEYANMQLWFSMLLCITLFQFFQTEKRHLLVFSALCLCAAVLSYPSCLLLTFGIGFLFFSQGKKKDFAAFLGICVVAGILYLCLTLSKLSLNEFLVFLENMMAIETSHAISIGTKLLGYLTDALKLLLVLGVAYGLSFITINIFENKAMGKKAAPNKESHSILTDMLFSLLIMALSLYCTFRWESYTRYGYSVLFVGIIFLGTRHAKKLSGEQKLLYLSGTIISVLNFGATLLLTDLELIGSVPYLLIAVVMSFLPIAQAWKQTDKSTVLNAFRKTVLLLGVFVLVFRNVYIIRPMYLQTNTIFDMGGIVKDGPALGIISAYMGPFMQNESLKEWAEYVPEGSNIYLIGDPLDTLGYLYGDTNVAAPSTVCTPGYNEHIAEYWEMNPHKYPDIVIASCWYGDLNTALTENEWIMNWLQEDFKPTHYVDGKYWRYYFREK